MRGGFPPLPAQGVHLAAFKEVNHRQIFVWNVPGGFPLLKSFYFYEAFFILMKP